jgi:hypothetical protein
MLLGRPGIRGVDGSAFTISLQHGRRSVKAGWWLGPPWYLALQLCRALERPTMWRFVHLMR